MVGVEIECQPVTSKSSAAVRALTWPGTTSSSASV
jgi:hypothetical protein